MILLACAATKESVLGRLSGALASSLDIGLGVGILMWCATTDISSSLWYIYVQRVKYCVQCSLIAMFREVGNLTNDINLIVRRRLGGAVCLALSADASSEPTYCDGAPTNNSVKVPTFNLLRLSFAIFA